MSAPTTGVGAVLIAGLRTHTNDWNTTNTGAALTTGDALEMLVQGTPKPKPNYVPNAGLIGGGVGLPRVGLSVGTYEWSGPVKFNGLFVSSMTRLFPMLFGSETTSSLGSGAYSHLYQWAANTTYKANFAWYDNLLYHDVPMTKCEGLMFEFEPGKQPVVTADLIGKRELVDNSGLNTSSNLNATTVTLPSQPAIYYPILSAATCTVRLKDASGGLLASGDTLYPNKITLQFKRKFERVFTTRNTPYVDEPIYGADLECGGAISFPISETAAEWNRLAANTETKLDIAFTGTTIGGGYTYKWFFEFPSVIPAPAGLWTPNKTDLLGYEFSFSGYNALSNPSGMNFARPRFTVTDATSADHATNGV